MLKCNSCDSQSCSAHHKNPNETDADFADRQKLQSRLCRIRHIIVVLSGKGGVGKSTVAVNLAMALMMSGNKVGLLDADIHGPSVPTMLGIEKATIRTQENDIIPYESNGMKVLSIGFLLPSQDDAVIWRGPMKMAVIKQFLKDVIWGDLDYLIIDSPPGTGDEPLSLFQLIGNLDGVVIVTTPQKVACADVRKSIRFCQRLQVRILGIIENMSGFACPQCHTITPILNSGGGRKISEDMNVPLLGSLPIDPLIAQAGDDGQPFVNRYEKSPVAGIMRTIVEKIQTFLPIKT